MMPWLARRLFPVLATAALVAVGMVSTTCWPLLVGKSAWALPHDLWGTLVAARRLVHGDWSGLYAKPTSLVTLPGAAVILAPVVVIIDAARLSLQIPGPHNPHPGVWLLAGPYEIAVSAVALFAADAIAEHLGVARRGRALLAAASAVALWSVAVRWGHPEDAVAVGLFLFGILALSRSQTGRSGWLIGAAVAVQPLVLLALPLAAVVIKPRRLAGFLARAAAPGALLLGAAAAANWKATVSAVTGQPNSPAVNHPTAWTSLAPHLGAGAVAAGPARVLAIAVACGCALHRRAPVARGAGLRWVELPDSPGAAVVGRGGAGAPLCVRAGDGRLLPVARPGGSAHRGVAELATPDHDLRRRRGAHLRLAALVAVPVDLVGADDRGTGPDPLPRPRPAAHRCGPAAGSRTA